MAEACSFDPLSDADDVGALVPNSETHVPYVEPSVKPEQPDSDQPLSSGVKIHHINPQTPVSDQTNTLCIIPDRTKRRCWIALLLLLLAGAIVGIVVGVTGGNGEVDAEPIASQTQDSGQIASPTSFCQTGHDLDGQADEDQFGWSVALSADGNRVAIGAPESNGNEEAGYVRIFDLSGGDWVQVGSILNGEETNDMFGWSVALSGDGNRIAIGAVFSIPGLENPMGGHVRILDWSESEWIQVGSNLDGEGPGDQFGFSVALSSDGNRVAIGAPIHGDLAGHVRIFDFSGGQWIQVGSDLDGEEPGDNFGASVALSEDGNRVAIGGIWNAGSGDFGGHVRIFDWSGNEWVKVGSDLDSESDGDEFGWSVSLSSDGNRVAIGAPSNQEINYNSGHVRIFDWSGNEWVQVGSDLDGKGLGDGFGTSVALSSDGNRVAIGAPQMDYASEERRGYVSIFDWSGSQWIQVGTNVDGEAADNNSGLSVALSSDGNHVAIGAPFNRSDNGASSGHVRMFDLVNSSCF